MNIKEILIKAIKKLNDNKFEDSNIIAKDLLAYVLKKERNYLLIHKDDNITQEQCNQFLNLIEEVISGKPLQYITHKQEFMGYDFYVDESVLIPQPDTEIIVEEVINICNNIYDKSKKIEILDLCTGSGAIAISLDKILNKNDNIKIYGSDISQDALNVAKINNKNNNSNITFICSDMFKNINKKFDIIVSNPPYIEKSIIKTLPIDVQSEPHIALDGGKDGLKFYNIIAKNANKYLKKHGYLCLEIDCSQGQSVKKILEDTHNYYDISVLKDLSDNNRCVIAKEY